MEPSFAETPSISANGTESAPTEADARPALTLDGTQTLEDSFATAGLLGLPEPTDLLQRFQEARDTLIAAENRVINFEERALEEHQHEVERLRSMLFDQQRRTTAQLDEVEKRFAVLVKQEGELVATRAAISSQLAAKRALYPQRLAEHEAKLLAESRRTTIEQLRQERELFTEVENAQGSGFAEHLRRRLEDARRALEAASDAQSRIEEVVAALERAGLSRPVAGFLLWVGVPGVLAAGWFIANEILLLAAQMNVAGSGPLAAIGGAIAGLVTELGAVRSLIVVPLALVATTVVVFGTLLATDIALRRVDPSWTNDSGKRISAGRLPASFAGGAGKRLSRGDLLARLARAPFLATAVIAAAPILALVAFSETLQANIASAAFWLDILSLVAGISVALIVAAAGVVLTSRGSDGDGLDIRAIGASRFLLPVLVLVAIAAAFVPLTFAGYVAPRYALLLATNILAAATVACGLHCRGLYRARDVRRSEARQAAAAVEEAARTVSGPFTPDEVLRRLAPLEASASDTNATDSAGSIGFLRPTRRFFRTPQEGDPLDKATLEEYSPADALLEPELLGQLFHNRAALEQVRAAVEAIRTERTELKQALATENAEIHRLGESGQAARSSYIQRIRIHTERMLRLQEQRATAELNARSAYLMGVAVRNQSDTDTLEQSHDDLAA
jgi:hypothetical protein